MRIFFTLFLSLLLIGLRAQQPSPVPPVSDQGLAANDLQRGLTGRVSDLNIQTVTQADTAAHYRFRCLRTINDNLQPLLVVDGRIRTLSAIGELNPNDIASVEVLKSAPATAIFGPDGVPGAIIVTAKQMSAPIEVQLLDSADRQPVARASVRLVNTLTGDTLGRIADDHGRIVFPGKSLYAKYEVLATATGYHQAKINFALLRQSGDSARIRLYMTRKVTVCPTVVVSCFDCARWIRCGSTVRVTRAVAPAAGPGREVKPVLSFFPNPVDRGKEFQFHCPVLLAPATLQLWSLGGQLMASHPILPSKAGTFVRITTDQRWSPGMYILRLYANNRLLASGKMIIE